MNAVSSQVAVVLLCLLFGAFFAGMETGLLSINRLRLRHLVRRQIRSAAIVDRLLQRPELLLGTTLIGTNLCYVMLSVYSTRLAARGLGSAGPVVASAVTTLVVLVGCEYLPKAWFQSFPARRVLPLAGVLDVFSRLLFPLSWLLHQIVHRLIPFPEEGPGDPAALITREELIHLAREGIDTGMLTREESRMIHGVFSMGSRTCGDLMIPMGRVIRVPQDADASRIREIALEHGFSRYPVQQNGTDAVLGILHLRDVLSRADPAGKTAQDMMHPPLLIPANTPVDHVLPRMRATGSPMMLVTGERRKVIGILTIEEVLAEIVGAAGRY